MSLEPALNSPEPVDAEISALAKRLNSRKETEVRAAVAQLIERGDAGMEALLTALSLMEKRRQRNLLYSTCLTIWVGTGLYLDVLLTPNPPKMLGFFGCLLVTVFLSWTGRTQKYGVMRLAQLEDARAVGVLVDAILWPNLWNYSVIVAALTRLLPRVKQNDAKYLTLERRKLLLSRFYKGHQSLPFLLAILKAFEQVGGAEAIPVVSALAAGKGRAAKDSALKAAAQECLPYLTARAEGRELRDTLLRSSSAAGVAPDTLLRPAPTTPTEPDDELLRPG